MRHRTIACILYVLSGCAASTSDLAEDPRGPSGAERPLPALERSSGPSSYSSSSIHSQDEELPPFTLSIRVNREIPNQIKPQWIQPGDIVHTGDGIAFHIEANAEAYIYVVSYSPDGWSELSYSSASLSLPKPLAPGTKLRVPRGELWLRFDEKTGQEVFLVIASRQPMDAETCRQARLSCLLQKRQGESRGDDSKKTTKSPPPPPPRQLPPPGLTADKRGGGRSSPPTSNAPFVVMSNERGIALAWLTFQHER